MLAWFVYHNEPWFSRGASHYHGSVAGLFNFHHASGHGYDSHSFRVVLIITMICLSFK